MKIQLLIVVFLGYAKCWPGILEKERKCGLSDSISLFDKSFSKRSISTKENLIFMTEFARFMNYKAPLLLQEFAERKKVSETKEKLRMLRFQTNLYNALARKQRPKRSYDIQGRQDVEEIVVGAVEDTADAVVEVVDAAVEGTDEVIGGAEDAVDDTVDAVEDVIDDTVDVVEDVVDDAVDAVEDVIDDTVDVVEDVADATVDAAGDTADAIEDVGNAAADLTEDVIIVVTNSTTAVIDLFTEIVESVGEVLETTLPPTVWNYLCVATWWPLDDDHCTAARCVACSPSITTASSVCKNTRQKIDYKCLNEVLGEGFCNYCIKEYLDQ